MDGHITQGLYSDISLNVLAVQFPHPIPFFATVDAGNDSFRLIGFQRLWRTIPLPQPGVCPVDRVQIDVH